MLFKGYNNTGIKEILDDAKVPKGSFYYYFKSKEDLGLHLLDNYFSFSNDLLDKCATENYENPIDALKCFFESFHAKFESSECRGGCPIGNLGQELSDTEDNIRVKVDSILNLLVQKITAQLKKAQEMQMISEDINTIDYAEFIFNSWEGALLRAKVKKSKQPLDLFINMSLNF